jgi:hypothetical protein
MVYYTISHNKTMKSAITISIDRDLLRACRSSAYAARRTLSSQIEQWIDEKLAQSASPPISFFPSSGHSTTPPSSSGKSTDPATPAAIVPIRQRREVVS